ncbi:hypothetical protein MPL1032_150128 [Mesorhizobium plurifarium]|uniref:Uncharacterized protein n=1 Tax=Mesorhizobium plurifarium TaxID=69974 RepID=A0A0K2VT32_MESPL|nr:hypothetical protein MPL1032_150128 [Mesorhizobium plurifarium]
MQTNRPARRWRAAATEWALRLTSSLATGLAIGVGIVDYGDGALFSYPAHGLPRCRPHVWRPVLALLCRHCRRQSKG